MKLLDLNLLLHAVNDASDQHRAARRWLDRVLGSSETIGIPWVVLLGFLRLATNKHVFTKPLTVAQALDIVQGWLDHPQVRAISPGDDHWTILEPLLTKANASGNLTTDAHLAALAIEHGCELCTTDGDFARFSGLRWRNPLAT
ncbi:MAG: type II toxin-antitoxin system VapC family toxin [Deltaproteobacteria bacterium]|nr:type II toxin-antitoxin system VapC family toxin [Deltaproteobacteria bacterium]